jgi:hypothetical protein
MVTIVEAANSQTEWEVMANRSLKCDKERKKRMRMYTQEK